MTMFLTLAPFGAFASLMMLSTVKVSLAAATIATAGLVVWDLARGRSIKIFSTGAMVIFASLWAYHMLATTAPDPTTVRIAVDGGMLAIALTSLALRFPFTLQYARETVDAQTQAQPNFIRTNYILSGVWSGAIVLMLLADIVAIYLPNVPLWTCAAIAFAARNSATLFTQWYPKKVMAAVAASEISMKPV